MPERDDTLTLLTAEQMRALSAHRERYLGPSPGVYAELVSDVVQVDLSPHGPREDRGTALVTAGASARPMPDAAGGSPTGLEVMTYVDGFVTDGQRPSEEQWWPARMLKQVARLPHNEGLFLDAGQTVAFADPPSPLTPGSMLTAVMLLSPPEDPDFEVADVPGGLRVRHLWVLPVTTAELGLCLEQGPNALLDVLLAAGLSLVCDAARSCAVTGLAP